MMDIIARPSAFRNAPYTAITPVATAPVCKSFESYGRIDKYRVLKQFGSNHLNPVFFVQSDAQKSKEDNKNSFYVIKTLELNDRSFTNEIRILSLPSHPNIVACKEILNSVAIELDFDIRIRNAIVLEYATNGDLFPYLRCGALPMSICRFYFGQLLDAISHLHANNYCHLDIKPENLLLDEKFNIKICDFGFATPYVESQGVKLIKSSCGTSAYFPPEAWNFGAKEKGYDGTKADVFQCGLMLFIMLTGQPPFSKSVVQDAWFGFIARGRWDEFWDYKEKGLSQSACMNGQQEFFSPELRELFRKMFDPKATERPSIQEIKKSKWFTETFPAEPIEVQFEMLNRKAMKSLAH